MISLSGKVALVTGGAVGTQLAHSLLSAGSNVAVVYRNPARERELSEEFSQYSGAFQIMKADLSIHAEAISVIDSVKDLFGGIDFLINSVGGWVGGKRLHEHSQEELQRMFSTDVVPTFNIMSVTLPLMAEQRFGRVINFISMQVFGAGAGNAVYSASKSAVLALTKAAAEEYKNDGVSVYAVAPSIIDTESNRRNMPNADTSGWVKIEDIADAVLFLCRTGNSLNGTILKFLP